MSNLPNIELEDFHGQISVERSNINLISLSDLIPNFSLPPHMASLRWDDNEQSIYLETIILDLPITPIFLVRKTEPEILHEILDGRQRVNAILSFINNMFPLKGLPLITSLEGIYYDYLPKQTKKKFNERSMPIVTLINNNNRYDSLLMSHLYGRLNMIRRSFQD